MKVNGLGDFFLTISMCLVLLAAPAFGQSRNPRPPLTLAQIFNALTGKSNKLPIAERNKIAVKKVVEVGIDFSITPDIKKELRKSGASEELIAAIERKSRPAVSRPNSAADETSAWESIKEGADEQEIREFLRKYPNGRLAVQAQNRLRALTESTKASEDSSVSEISAISDQDDLGIAGTWTGTRGLEDATAFLMISGSRGQDFTGVLKLKGYTVAVQGRINRKTRRMTMQEVKIISAGSEMNWILSSYSGSLSRDNKEISGVMKEKSSPDSANTAWSFARVD
jgi:hypothetical protein